MQPHFKTIGLFAKPNDEAVKTTFFKLVDFLQQQHQQVKLFIEQTTATNIFGTQPLTAKVAIKEKTEIAKHCDLIIVVGGDGSLLNAARSVVDQKVPILGINRGKLGFLADIPPHQLEAAVAEILAGSFIQEERSVLNATIIRNDQQLAQQVALNDVVMFSGSIARMIEFEIFIDNHFMLQQRSDGIIAATPTGSTAYALSGGGPILYPTIDAFCLVPMFPHTLSNRPIVIQNQSVIKIVISEKKLSPTVSFDGQEHIKLQPRDEIIIKAHPTNIKLLHPKGYNYFAVLREKLGWNSNKFVDR
jgi:NAD+ kinase